MTKANPFRKRPKHIMLKIVSIVLIVRQNSVRNVMSHLIIMDLTVRNSANMIKARNVDTVINH